MDTIQNTLTGGDPRSLGKTADVVTQVLAGELSVEELYTCMFNDDEIVRMRAGDALEKVCRERPELVVPFTERLLKDVPRVRQPSIQWHLAQMFTELPLTKLQTERATQIIAYNVQTLDEWVVTNVSLEALATFTRKGSFDVNEFLNLLAIHQHSRHKSVATRATRLLAEFTPR